MARHPSKQTSACLAMRRLVGEASALRQPPRVCGRRASARERDFVGRQASSDGKRCLRALQVCLGNDFGVNSGGHPDLYENRCHQSRLSQRASVEASGRIFGTHLRPDPSLRRLWAEIPAPDIGPHSGDPPDPHSTRVSTRANSVPKCRGIKIPVLVTTSSPTRAPNDVKEVQTGQRWPRTIGTRALQILRVQSDACPKRRHIWTSIAQNSLNPGRSRTEVGPDLTESRAISTDFGAELGPNPANFGQVWPGIGHI